MTDMIKVANADNLVRDSDTGAIINMDSAGYENYLKRKQKIRAEKQQMQDQQNTINTLAQEVSDLKSMMQTLIASLTTNSIRG